MNEYQIYNFCTAQCFVNVRDRLNVAKRQPSQQFHSPSGERSSRVVTSPVSTTMSTMNDVHQFRVRTPSFLISADNNLPVQVRLVVVVTSHHSDWT